MKDHRKEMILSKGRGGQEAEAKELLEVGLSEIEEIADAVFRKIDEKIRTLRSAEDRIDAKMLALEKLIEKSERLQVRGAAGPESSSREIKALAGKGLKVDEIAGIVDMPRGEVELILELGAG